MKTPETSERWIVFHGTLGGPCSDGEGDSAHQHVVCITVGPVPSSAVSMIADTPPPSAPVEGASPMTLAGIFDHEPTEEEADALHAAQLFNEQGFRA